MKPIAWIVGTFLFVLGPVQTASAQPTDLRVIDVGYSGSGCSTESVGITPDGLSFTKLIAQTVSGGPTSDRKSCQVRVTMQFDPEWSVSIENLDYRGYAKLQPGVKGVARSSYFFAGMPPSSDTLVTTELTGPFDGKYSRGDDMAPTLLFSPCGQSQHDLVIHLEARIFGGEGTMTLDWFSANLHWKRCT